METFTNAQVTSTSIPGYFLAPGSNFLVKYGGTDTNGTYVTGSVYFNVSKPTATITSHHGYPLAFSNYPYYTLEMGNLSGTTGIDQSASAWSPSLYGGSYNGVQILTTYNVQVNGIERSDNLTQAGELDAQFPYMNVNGSDMDDTPETTVDSPGGVPWVEFTFDATDYLMWKSPAAGSIWVPIGHAEWTGEQGSGPITWRSTGTIIADPPVYGDINEPSWNGIYTPPTGS